MTQKLCTIYETRGNLAVKSLNDIVKKEFFVLDSEYLTTLLVAVPKALAQEWVNSYERLTQMVVPRSSSKLVEDDEYALFNVTLFRRIVDEFSQKARESKFIVRDFNWDPDRLVEEKKQANEAFSAEREQWTTLVRLCKTNFGELFSCSVHIKCLRLFVESILRYGLPPNFQPLLAKALPKQESKVREALNSHFSYLEKGISSGKDSGIEEGYAHLVDKDYSPVVYFEIPSIL